MKWKYYNGAIVPDGYYRENLIRDDIPVRSLFKQYPKSLMIRFTTDADYTYDEFIGNWWHCIKDCKYDPTSLKSKRKNEIRKARNYFNVIEINPLDFIDEFYDIIKDANLGYSVPISFTYDDAIAKCSILSKLDNSVILGAFSIDDKKLCAYLWLNVDDDCVTMVEQKAIRKYERFAVNAALCDAMCLMFNDKLAEGFCIYDGDRNVLHQTNFQEYLIKYFGFRKQFCKLNIIYRPVIVPVVKFMYLFRKSIYRFGTNKKNKILRKILSLLLMEDIARQYR